MTAFLLVFTWGIPFLLYTATDRHVCVTSKRLGKKNSLESSHYRKTISLLPVHAPLDSQLPLQFRRLILSPLLHTVSTRLAYETVTTSRALFFVASFSASSVYLVAMKKVLCWAGGFILRSKATLSSLVLGMNGWLSAGRSNERVRINGVWVNLYEELCTCEWVLVGMYVVYVRMKMFLWKERTRWRIEERSSVFSVNLLNRSPAD